MTNPLPAANSRCPFALDGAGRFAAPWLRRSLAPRRLWLREIVRLYAHENIGAERTGSSEPRDDALVCPLDVSHLALLNL